jgi:cobalt-zinc-cadmium efflux system outer membrane protein
MTRVTSHGMREIGVLTLFAALCAGCVTSHHATESIELAPLPMRPRIALLGAPIASEPLQLDDLLTLAARHHPDLQIAKARIEASRGKLVQAGLYPNPVMGPRMNQLGDGHNALGEAGFTVMQTIVTANKLDIAQAAARCEIDAASWQALARWHDVMARARVAFFDWLTAQRELDTVQEIVRVSDEAVQSARKLAKAGAGNRPDELRAKVEWEQNRLRFDIAQKRLETTRQNLLTALGRPDITLDLMPESKNLLDLAPPVFEWSAMVERLRDYSSELQTTRATIAQLEKLEAKAKADVIPNVDVTLNPFYSAPIKEMHGLVIVTAAIPIFNRNQGNIQAARADLARAHAEERQTELRLIDRLAAAYQRYQAGKLQTEAFQKHILPDARESLKLVQAGYRQGDAKYDYTAVLQAQQVLFQAQLTHTLSLGDLWRSIAEIAGILELQDATAGCAPPR